MKSTARTRYCARLLALTTLACLGRPSPGFSTLFWNSVGPQPLPSTVNTFSVDFSGRVAALAVDPSNADHWLLGAAQGGIWESTDAGSTWAARTDDQASLAMGAIAFAGSNPALVYAGTGEANFAWDSFAGAGLLLSQDGGTTWGMLNSSFAQTAFSTIKVDPSNPNSLVAATVRGVAGKVAAGTNIPPSAPARGVFISTDGGTNFTRILTGEATALEVNPNNFSEQYTGLGEAYGDLTNGVYRTTNGWQTSEPIQGPWPAVMTNISYTYTNIPIATNLVITCTTNNGTNNFCYTNTVVTYTNIVTGTNTTISSGGRVAVAVSPSNPDTLYVAIANPRNVGGLAGIWQTANAWAPTPTWTQLPAPLFGSAYWYSLALAVDPTDSSVLYFAQFSLQQFAGGAWTEVAPNTHPDNHALAWAPAGGGTWRLVLGNDGGAWASTVPVSTNWTCLNTNLAITQFWKGSESAGSGVFLLGGTQDNGTVNYSGELAWNTVFGGDGCDCAISSANPETDWALSFQTTFDDFGNPQTVEIFRTEGPGTNQPQWAADGIDPSGADFFVHFEKSLHDDNLFIAGTTQLWRCTNFFNQATPHWDSNSPMMLDTNGLGVQISAMAFAPSDTSGLTYAFGTQDGQLQLTTNGGNSWNNLDAANAVPDRYVTGLAFNPSNADTLFVALSGFDEGTPSQPGHLFRTTDALSASPSWTNASPPTDLPNDCLLIDPSNPSTLYVGCDLGVWTSPNSGASWTHLGPSQGLPNVAVFDLRMNSSGNLVAFTHGRGAFLYALPHVPIIQVEGPILPVDYGGCLTCPPFNWLNPGDLVEVEFPLVNIVPVDTADLTVSLVASPQITPVSGTRSLGVLQGQGPPVSARLAFIAGGAGGAPPPPAPGPGSACGDTVEVVLQLNDGALNLGQVSVPFRLGTPSHPLREVFTEASVPALPRGWSTSASIFGDGWATTSNSPPNVVAGFDPDEPGDTSGFSASPPNVVAFAPALPGRDESVLVSPPFPVATSLAQLYFREAYSVSNLYDGCVLEIAVGSLPFTDILRAGGSFAQNGYNATLNDFNPLGLRRGWSGDSGGWIPVLVNLPSSAAGQTVQVRWNFATSRGLTNGGWFIDPVLVTEPICLPPVSDPVILNPRQRGQEFTFSFNTVSGRTYLVEYKTNLNDGSWQILQTNNGDGTQQTIVTPLGASSQRFFRFQLQ